MGADAALAIKIYIDQGHNPQNPNSGAEGNGLREQDLTYDIGVILAALFSENPNFEVKLSRNSPTEVLGTSNASSLAHRVNEANDWGANYFISLHANASDNSSASGVESLVYSTDSKAASLGADIAENVAKTAGIQNRGVTARPGLYVLRKTQMPAVLVEMGFITSPLDSRLMSEEPELFALGIYNGVLQYLGLS